MAKVLYIESSPRKERSHSIKVAQAFLDTYKKNNPEDTVEELDLWNTKLPEFDGPTIAARYNATSGTDNDSEAQKAWEKIKEMAEHFKSFDKVVIGIPMWNFSVPYKFKHYVDCITQPGLTFGFHPKKGYFGLVENTKALIVYASGGQYAEEGARALDRTKPYMKQWLGFMGITDVSEVTVDGTLYGETAAAEADRKAKEQAEDIANIF